MGEAALGAEPLGVVAGGDQQRTGRVRTHSVAGHQPGGGLGDERLDQRVDLVDLDIEALDASGSCRGDLGGAERVTAAVRTQGGGSRNQPGVGRETGGAPQRAEVVQGGGDMHV